MQTPIQELISELEELKRNHCKSLTEVLFFDAILAIIEPKYLVKKFMAIEDAVAYGFKDASRKDSDLQFSDYYNKTYGENPAESDKYIMPIRKED